MLYDKTGGFCCVGTCHGFINVTDVALVSLNFAAILLWGHLLQYLGLSCGSIQFSLNFHLLKIPHLSSFCSKQYHNTIHELVRCIIESN